MDKYDKIIDLTKRRGFLWNSFEIYGGIAGFFDYGPLGAILKSSVINTWRKHYIINEGFYEIDSPTVNPYEVLKASGHVENFTDPLVECKSCLESFRADHIIEENIEVDTEGKTLNELQEMIEKNNIKCPKCGGEFKEVNTFNLMFATSIGPGGKRAAFMRPETAQGIFIQFKRISQFFRNKLPYGAVQIGKAYRNEISPRQGVIRLREFTQAEAEFFIDSRKKENFEKFESVKDLILPLLPGKNQENESLSSEEKIVRMSLGDAVKNKIIAHEAIAYYIAVTKKFLMDIGIDETKLRFRQHLPNEMAHYAADCWDAELYTDRYGWIECVGIADRTDYDLRAHMKNSGEDLSVFVEFDESKEIEVYEIELNYKLVGKTFKGDAKILEESLKELSNDKMEELIKTLKNNEKYILKTCKRDFEVLNEYLTVKKVKKNVTGEKIVPHVIEPSYGIDRITYCVIEHAFKEEDDRTLLAFVNTVSPVKVGVFPLVNKEGMDEIAENLKNKFRKNGIIAEYDDSGAIGRRYMRMDEIGTPFCVTVDGETLKDNTVTIRERDSREQFRIPLDGVVDYIKEKL